MVRGVRWYLVGSVVLGVLGVLAGCSGGSFMAEREPWRHQAEAQCLDSGAVKEGAGKVRIRAINGPGMCGADFPMKVSALGENTAVLGYSDEVRPPGAIPRAGATTLRWPGAPVPPAPTYPDSYEPRPASTPSIQSRPLPAPGAPRYETEPQYEQPLSLDPPPSAGQNGPTYQPYDFRKPFGGHAGAAARGAPRPVRSPRLRCSPAL